MIEDGLVQCQRCGHVHKTKVQLSDDDLYVYKYCPKCRDETSSLYCGKDKTDVYIYYNINLDARYYK